MYFINPISDFLQVESLFRIILAKISGLFKDFSSLSMTFQLITVDSKDFNSLSMTFQLDFMIFFQISGPFPDFRDISSFQGLFKISETSFKLLKNISGT